MGILRLQSSHEETVRGHPETPRSTEQACGLCPDHEPLEEV